MEPTQQMKTARMLAEMAPCFLGLAI